MLTVVERMSASEDPLERDLAAVLVAWQNQKRAEGRRGSLGYEPREINRLGAVEVIARRVRSRAVGFGEVPAAETYELIVLRYPERFPKDVIEIARERLAPRTSADPTFTSSEKS